MNFFSNSLVYFIKKPLIPIYIAVITLIYCISVILNPFRAVTEYLAQFAAEDIGHSVILFSKTVYNIKNIPYILLGILAVSIVAALFSSLIFSGYMNIIHLTVKRIKTDFSHYVQGLQKGFFRSAMVFFQLYASLLLFIGFVPLAGTTYFILRDSVAESQNNPTMLYVLAGLLITIGVLMCIMIYMNFMFKFPSIFHFSKYPLEKAAAALNARYWRTLAKSSLLLLFYAAVQFIMFHINNIALEFLVGFVLYTVYFSFFAVFPFYIFDTLIEPYRVSYSQMVENRV